MVTYPETRRYSWEVFGALKVPITGRNPTTWAKLARAAYKAAIRTPQKRAWKDVCDALEDIECDYNIHELTPKRFKQLLVAAAKKHEWWGRTSSRKDFTAEVEGQPDMRRCYKCLEVKPRTDFRAVVTPNKKKVYRHNPDERTYYTHTLCAKCRANKTHAANRVSAKAFAKAGEIIPADVKDLVKRLRSRMAMLYHRSSSCVESDPMGLSMPTHFHMLRIECINRARAKLDEYIFKKEPRAEYPEDWRHLLTDVAQAALQEMYNEKVLQNWSGKGRMPTCF